MIKTIIKDEEFLKIKSRLCTKDDAYIIADLKDTLLHNKERCVGLAANMLGNSIQAIVLFDNDNILIMLNPEILQASQQYTTTESCLSLTGSRETKRYKKIKIKYLNEKFQVRIKTFTDFSAQIIQHEIDHCNGIII